jgi:S-adenosyl-L-methionine hydrolase (adenosine-forming)
MKPTPRVITLTTDFGCADWFVGAMKGVIWGINARAQIADICHEIRPGDIAGGAFVLANVYCSFPKGTLHVVVVDPGVGSGRPAIVVQTRNYYFIAPDNGVLSLALSRESVTQVRRLENPRFFRHPVSSTFHGRDVFAPVAAHLSLGKPVTGFGPRASELSRLDWPEAHQQGRAVHGEICYLDRFGNAITNIPGAWITGDAGIDRLCVKGRALPLAACYQAVPKGQAMGVVGSHGYVEIAVNGGSAHTVLKLKLGTRVTASAITGAPDRATSRREATSNMKLRSGDMPQRR